MKTSSYLVLLTLFLFSFNAIAEETENATVTTEQSEDLNISEDQAAPESSTIEIATDEEIPQSSINNADQTENDLVKPTEKCKTSSKSCEGLCSCMNSRNGGGVFVMILFNDFSSQFGDFDGPAYLFGGRGFGYFGKNNNWRLGALAAFGTGNTNDGITLKHDIYTSSTKRSITGGFGGFTAEYVLRASDIFEFPVGFMIGGGGSSFKSDVHDGTMLIDNVVTSYENDSGFFAFMPMIGMEIVITKWMMFAFNASYLFTEPIDSGGRHMDGFSIMLGLNFGKFLPDEMSTEEE